MDFQVCGLLDIIIVVFGLIFIVLGYKKGFIKKILSIVGFLAITIFAFIYCKQLASFLIEKEIIYPSIYNPILEHLLIEAAKEGLEPTSTLTDFLTTALQIPAPLSQLFSKVLDVSGSVEEMCVGISVFVSTIAMNIISFFLIVVGTSIVVLILKLVTNIMRKVTIIRIIDGILGAGLYFAFFLIIVYVCFTVIQISMEYSWFVEVKNFLIIDMKLPVNGEQTPFRLSRFIYENNVLYKLIEMFI